MDQLDIRISLYEFMYRKIDRKKQILPFALSFYLPKIQAGPNWIRCIFLGGYQELIVLRAHI